MSVVAFANHLPGHWPCASETSADRCDLIRSKWRLPCPLSNLICAALKIRCHQLPFSSSCARRPLTKVRQTPLLSHSTVASPLVWNRAWSSPTTSLRSTVCLPGTDPRAVPTTMKTPSLSTRMAATPKPHLPVRMCLEYLPPLPSVPRMHPETSERPDQ